MNVIRVQTANGDLIYLQVDDAYDSDDNVGQLTPLRLTTRPLSAAQTMLSEDILRRILQKYLTPLDWLAVDGTCRAWRQATPWSSSSCDRRQLVRALYWEQRMTRTWHKLYGFVTRNSMSRQHRFHGPVSLSHLQALQNAVHPWVLPQALVASMHIHDGEVQLLQNGHLRGGGLYLGTRLLTVQEIIDTLSMWRQLPLVQQETNMVRIPLFASVGPRQVAMELYRKIDNHNITNDKSNNKNDETGTISLSHHHYHGRIVLINATAPWTPHVGVLAATWADFLTLF